MNPSSQTKYPSPPSSPTPLTTQTSQKCHVKMIALKIIASIEQAKKLNEKLQASQTEEPQNSHDSL